MSLRHPQHDASTQRVTCGNHRLAAGQVTDGGERELVELRKNRAVLERIGGAKTR